MAVAEGNAIFGTAKIGKLMWKFSIPCIVSMLVNSIYNLVDQIFIGRYVGYLGNGATSVSFPFVTTTMALSLLVAAGTAANISLNLGRGDQEKANRCFGNGIVMSLTVGIFLMVVGEVFLVPLLKLFGATVNILPYAQDYARITLIGAPFMCIGMLMNDLIRADGSPTYSMMSTGAGAVTNIILDYVFLRFFSWGVQGAAAATVLGQILTAVISIMYFKRFRLIKYKRDYLKLDSSIIKLILSIGFSSFITQMASVFVMVTLNNVFKKYGALSIYGPDIPLTCFGIVMKLNQVFVSIIMGLTLSTQPIFGFNYGACLYRRVRELIYRTAAVTVLIGGIAVLVIQLFPQQLINIFGQEDALYNEFANMCIRTITILMFVIGLQFTSIMYYQSTGQPLKALILSLSRQIIFLIPLAVFLPTLFDPGVKGVLYAFPISDFLAAVVALVLLIRELRRLGVMIAEEERLQAAEVTQ